MQNNRFYNILKEASPLIFIYSITALIVVGTHAFMGFSYFQETTLLIQLARSLSAFFTGLCAGVVLGLLKIALKFNWLKLSFDYVMYLAAVIIGFVECFCVCKFETLYNGAVVNNIFTTDLAETSEFLKVYMDAQGIFILIVFLALAIYGRKSANLCTGIVNLISRFKFATAITLIISIAIINYGKIGFFHEYETLPAVRLYNAFHYINKTRKRMLSLAANLKNTVTITEDNSDIPNIIFVVGESESKHFMSLYGYNKKTTPYCDDYEKAGNLLKFSDVVSAQAVTGLATNLILTFLNNESKSKDLTKTNNFINAFKKCGYKTYWASNQTLYGVDVSYLTYCSKCCDYAEYTVSNFNAEHVAGIRKNDDSLIPILDGFLKKEESNKNFYFFHLLGSHYEYRHRYPNETFSFFKESDIEDKYNKEQKPILAYYLNSLRFTDHILHEIIKRFEDKNAILVYISDHGEEMWQSGFVGHSATNISKWMVEIPMFFWYSNSFKEKYPEKIDKIKSALDKPFMTDDIIHMLLDLADIKTSEYDATRSVINKDYISRKRKIDYFEYDKN